MPTVHRIAICGTNFAFLFVNFKIKAPNFIYTNPINVLNDIDYMRLALQEAERGCALGEIPVGAVIVGKGRVIARAHNLTETLTDVTAHAELLAITSAEIYLGSKFLNECTLYVTLEPCVMCAGAIFWSQLSRVVFGASDSKRGFRAFAQEIIRPRTEVVGEVLAEESSVLLKSFFARLRQ